LHDRKSGWTIPNFELEEDYTSNGSGPLKEGKTARAAWRLDKEEEK
jgi:hypothetical protein